MIRVRLREAMETHSVVTGEKLTYERLAVLSGISRSALESLAGRTNYNPTLDVIDRLCGALNCSPNDLLERVVSPDTRDGLTLVKE
jgi:DNA-binding Xre family transcriptional regulator